MALNIEKELSRPIYFESEKEFNDFTKYIVINQTEYSSLGNAHKFPRVSYLSNNARVYTSLTILQNLRQREYKKILEDMIPWSLYKKYLKIKKLKDRL